MAVTAHTTIFLSTIIFSIVSAISHEPKLATLKFPLTAVPVLRNFSSSLLAARGARRPVPGAVHPAVRTAGRTPVKYSVALTVSLPVGTPPQTQDMVIDTGSQLSWVQCNRKSPRPPPPPASVFDPSLSSSFSAVPCNQPICKPPVPDYTLPTTCDQNRQCHYSYFYADGTLAEGNLVREKLAFSGAQSTPPIVLGCATASTDNQGILGMNLGRLSFPSQAKIGKFSYCVPVRTVPSRGPGPFPTGSFILGENPNSAGFQYVNLITFPQGQTMPNLDPLAYTVPMQGIRIGAKRLDIPPAVFRPDAGGSGQTMIDSGSEFTYLVDTAYEKVRAEIVRLVGPKMKKGYTSEGGAADMCFDSRLAPLVGRLIGGIAFEFGPGVEIDVPSERVLTPVVGGVHCVAIAKSGFLGAASNIIGNIYQQNTWVEFDLVNHRVGFGKADCSKS